ncbi:MAG: glutamyl-tRNA reductase [Micrococcales bacterium]|nr:glutamyl-tRNA reductase [Micrococcales bacterium]
MIDYSIMVLCAVVADHVGSGLDVLAALSAGVRGVGPELVRTVDGVNGVVALSTCNRVELYLDVPWGDQAAQDAGLHAARLLAVRSATQGEGITVHTGRDAVAHLFSVASGLESMVVGEREIVSQVRAALTTARSQRLTAPLLEAAFQTALRVSRTVVGAVPLDMLGRSVVSEALDLTDVARPGARALLVGTGSYAGACLAALRARGVQDVRVFSGSGRAHGFAARHQVDAAEDLDIELTRSDLVVACSGAGPVLSARQVADAGRPLALIDLALRRDVAPEVADLPGVRLVALADVAESTPRTDVAAASALVASATDEFMRERRAREWSGELVAARAQVLRACLTDDDPALARRLAHREMHAPTVRAKAAAAQGDRTAYAAALAEVAAMAELTGPALTGPTFAKSRAMLSDEMAITETAMASARP